MDLTRWIVGGLSLLLFVAQPAALKAETPAALDEIYELLRTNLVDVSQEQLDRAAVEGLIARLAPRVQLLSEKPVDGLLTNGASGRVFDRAFAYLRLGQVRPGIAEDMARVYESLASSNKIKGIVLDLRFSAGEDYGAALTAANWFVSSEQPLIDWGEGMKKSAAREKALKVPVMVLVNNKTAGAAEAFAAMLRHTDVALILGTNTAGTAAIARDFTLSTGQRVRVYGSPVKLGDGEALPISGVKPDIQVEVSEADELLYLSDAYRVIPKAGRLAGTPFSESTEASGTNRPARRRINEAELVRMQRDGQELNFDAPDRTSPEPEKPVIWDPTLARALDLLKGLSVVQNVRTP